MWSKKFNWCITTRFATVITKCCYDRVTPCWVWCLANNFQVPLGWNCAILLWRVKCVNVFFLQQEDQCIAFGSRLDVLYIKYTWRPILFRNSMPSSLKWPGLKPIGGFTFFQKFSAIHWRHLVNCPTVTPNDWYTFFKDVRMFCWMEQREPFRVLRTKTGSQHVIVVKKTHSIKNNLLCIGNLRIVWLSSTYEGHWSVHAPKKPKGKELITAEKQENRRISGIRIKVEHAIGGMKKCRIVKERFRCHKFGFEDMVILIACGLHNFRITHKMSHITI